MTMTINIHKDEHKNNKAKDIILELKRVRDRTLFKVVAMVELGNSIFVFKFEPQSMNKTMKILEKRRKNKDKKGVLDRFHNISFLA